ncbi:MAG TPA: 3-keto-5-aminohexanoate cleavage protein [Thermoleophilaceae bacterium]|nr:3-keto-5-aminohexanoate cleavage protein [Thermoleophilaceae bacterium]
MSGEAVEPLILNVAPTGMIPVKSLTPHVPTTTEEILEEVHEYAKLGVSIVHVHARADDESPTHRKELFAPIIEGIRAIDPQLIVCATCSGRMVTSVAERGEVLELEGSAKPDMGSLTLGSNNFIKSASVNPPEVVQGLAERMKARQIKPELEVFEPGMVHYGRHLAERGLIDEPCYVNILLGNLGTSPLAPGTLAAFLALIPDTWTWALAGLGRYQLDANLMAIAAGGHVRVGIEDNIWYDRGRTRLATNRELIMRVARLADEAERPLATPREAREALGLRLSPA